MSVVSVSHAPQYSPLFNRLKRSIFQALEHDKTDGAARERLSGAVVSAAFAVIRKEESFELSPVECRRALTRMPNRSEEHTSELQSLMRISYAVFCLKKKNIQSIPSHTS